LCGKKKGEIVLAYYNSINKRPDVFYRVWIVTPLREGTSGTHLMLLASLTKANP